PGGAAPRCGDRARGARARARPHRPGSRRSDCGRNSARHPERDGRREARQGGRPHEVPGMTPVAVRAGRMTADTLVGAVLAETLLAPDDHHRVLLPKGRILRAEDLPLIERARPSELHVVRLDPGDVHEDAAARRLAAAVAGPGITVHGPVESQMRLAADINGILRIDVARLDALNGIPDMS